MMTITTQLSIESSLWEKTDFVSASFYQKLFESTFDYLQKHQLCPVVQKEIQISVLLTDDAAIKELNHDYRGKDKPTNILSFPMDNLFDSASLLPDQPLMLGDLILAHETIWREADFEGKSVHDHLIHLLIHGLLHLLGYDHIEDKEAETMESLEIDILKTLNIKNPYVKSHTI